MISRKCFLVGLLAIGCVTSVVPAASQSYPTRSITLVVPFPAGAATDAVARIVSEHMAKTLGQAIVGVALHRVESATERLPEV